jgi:DNA polymerase I-like protein with 3'-5' exonuclease and polymerase domains
MRGFMVFGEDAPGFYLDWSQQEVIIGAALSRDLALIDAYRSGDIYHAFARTIGLTNDPDPNHWKRNDPDKIPDRMKILYLAIMYGMGINSIATSLQRHPIIAMELIELHRRCYPRFWQWREEQASTAMLDRTIYSEQG